MLFLTALTPSTDLATSTALAAASGESTKPLNCTTPLKVSTLIWSTLSIGSRYIAALTLDVRTEASIYSPVLSRVEVPAQPGLPAIHPIKKSPAKKRLITFALSTISPPDNMIKNFAEMTGGMHFHAPPAQSHKNHIRNKPKIPLTIK